MTVSLLDNLNVDTALGNLYQLRDYFSDASEYFFCKDTKSKKMEISVTQTKDSSMEMIFAKDSIISAIERVNTTYSQLKEYDKSLNTRLRLQYLIDRNRQISNELIKKVNESGHKLAISYEDWTKDDYLRIQAQAKKERDELTKIIEEVENEDLKQKLRFICHWYDVINLGIISSELDEI